MLWWSSDVWSRMSPFILAHALEFVYSTLGVFSCISTFTCFHWLCSVCFGLTQFISLKLHVLTLVILYIFLFISTWSVLPMFFLFVRWRRQEEGPWGRVENRVSSLSLSLSLSLSSAKIVFIFRFALQSSNVTLDLVQELLQKICVASWNHVVQVWLWESWPEGGDYWCEMAASRAKRSPWRP